MAFIQSAGKGFVVKQGNNGKIVGRFGTRDGAQKEVDRLHRKNKPKSVNRGASARNKQG